MRHALIGLVLMGSTLLPAPASAALNISIGINVPTYPALVRIPNYPVYYAPSLRANYFFYDGLYWVLSGDTWYDSPWYNGPWEAVDPIDVPDFLLRVPVRYYRFAPAYFHGWAYDAAPRWGEHWGSNWQSRRSGWDTWKRGSAPAPAPLPTYQRSYSGSRYPATVSQQAAIQTHSSYSYQPRESVSRQQFQERRTQASTAPQPSAQQSSMQQRFTPGQPVRAQRTQERVAPAQAATQQSNPAQRGERPVEQRQQAQQQTQQRAAQQQQAQQRQVQQREAAQQARVQQAPQRAERAQQQQAQRVQQAAVQQQHAPAPQQRAERAQPQAQQHEQHGQQHENRGQDKGKDHDRKEGG